MNNIIIRETSSEIRAIARNALRGNWPGIVLGVFLFELLLFTVPDLLTVLIPGSTMTYFYEAVGRNVSFSYVANLYDFFLNGAFTLGLSYFLLAFFRKKDINHGYLFNGFEQYIKALGLFLVIGIFTFLWTLLFVIPGIVAFFRYSQAFYILADHPEKGIMECFNESKRMMYGNKGKLFALSLSFIGWAILASLIPSFFFVYSDSPITIIRILMGLVASIPMYFVTAYLRTAMTVFYDLVSGNLVAKPAFREQDYNFTPRYVDQDERKDNQ